MFAARPPNRKKIMEKAGKSKLGCFGGKPRPFFPPPATTFFLLVAEMHERKVNYFRVAFTHGTHYERPLRTKAHEL